MSAPSCCPHNTSGALFQRPTQRVPTRNVLDDVRSQIAPDDAALKETRARRDTTRAATKAFDGVRHSFASGSLAHGTANCPIHERDKGLDADTGVVLDRRSHPTLEPDAEEQDGPTPSGEDPTVDLVVGLERADKPGLWIPNTEARVTRLAKAENKRTAVPPLCSFNVEAFGLMFVEQGMDEPSALLALWEEGARALRRRLTPDPAGVSKPIKVLDRPRAIERLEFAAGQLAKALDHDDDEAKGRATLQPLWPDFIAERPGEASKARTAAALRRRSSLGITGTGVLTTSGGTTLAKQPRCSATATSHLSGA
jgi:hypothetical protein